MLFLISFEIIYKFIDKKIIEKYQNRFIILYFAQNLYIYFCEFINQYFTRRVNHKIG